MQIRMKYLLMHWSQRWIQTEWIYNTNIPCKFQQSHDQRLDRQTKAIIQTEILLQFPHNAEWLLSYLHSNFSDTFFLYFVRRIARISFWSRKKEWE